MFISLKFNQVVLTTFIFLSLGMPSGVADAQEIVVPNVFDGLESSGVNGIPFHLSAVSSVPSMRFQQLFNASQFGGNSGVIDKISFRPDAVFGAAFSETNIDIEISLSHNSTYSLFTRFDDNVGSDQTLVLKTSSLALSSSFTGPIDGPKDFDIQIDLQTTFIYNGVDHLLLDIKLLKIPTTTFFDAANIPALVRRLFSSTVDGSAESEFGVVINFGQLITKFTISEPVLIVAVDVKPDSFPNCFSINGAGVIPVAVLGNADVDVREIDLNSLRFAGLTGGIRGNSNPQCDFSHIDTDEFEDLVCHFTDDTEAWNPDDGTAQVVGNLSDGRRFEGTDSICVQP